MDIKNIIKDKKSMIKIIIIALLFIIVIWGIICFVKKNPERIVKKFVEAINNADEDKIESLLDIKGRYAFIECDKDDDEFKDEYKDATDEDVEEFLEEYLNDKVYANLDDFSYFEDYDSIELKKIKKVKKLNGGIYRVKAKVKFEDGDYDFSPDYNFYILKNKIIHIEED